jgi:hypothetical protein
MRDIFVAIQEALLAEPEILAVYAGLAPTTALKSYVTLGNANQDGKWTFNAELTTSEVQISCWANDRETVIKMYEAARRALHRKLGKLRLVMIMMDYDNKSHRAISMLLVKKYG